MTSKNKNLDIMVAQLSPYLNQFEMDRILDFMYTIDNSEFEINYTVDDASSQLSIILGPERYQEIKIRWSKNNQPLVKDVGTKKYMEISTGKLYDGLDPTDNIKDYIEIYV